VANQHLMPNHLLVGLGWIDLLVGNVSSSAWASSMCAVCYAAGLQKNLDAAFAQTRVEKEESV
jgi:hypothetical protein